MSGIYLCGVYNIRAINHNFQRKEKNMDRIRVPKMSEFLWEDFMKPLHISAYKLAKEIYVPVSRIQDILHDRRKVTADTSIRLGKYFGVGEKFFLNLQNDIDMREAKRLIGDDLEKIAPISVDNASREKIS